MRKRLLSITVVLTMLLSFIPTNIAFAATGQEVVDYAYNTWKGTPWKSYTNPYGPGIGVDCSYLVQNAYNHFGYLLPRSTYDQRYQGTSVDLSGLKYSHDYSALKQGDIIFFNDYGHVGLYAGNGNFVHTSYSRGVVKQALYGDGYNWHQYACEVRRIIDSPLPHTHSWTYGNDASHPHLEYRTCSCGEKQYTGKTKLVSTCQQCYPLGNVNLTRSFNRVSRNATFYRNNVANANSYTLTLYKDGASNGTSYNMSSTEKTVSSLASGTYTATLTAKNTNTNQTKTASALSFTIVDTYDVIFDANGGTNAPSAQTKIKDENLTLTSAAPKRAHYIFKGWAANKNETEPQYLAGGTYTKNTRITLYAVWEPETYTINFDTNGGKGEVESTTITYGNTMKMPNTIVRDGYYLKGWSKTKGATTPDYKLGLDHMLDSNMTLYAVWGQSTWGGTVATEFAGGDGTEENPYQISNAAELALLAHKVNNQQSEPEYTYYILTENIDLNHEEWLPIGLYENSNQYFKGSFDGNGYTVSSLNISDINEGYVGLFGYTKNSTLKSLTLSGDIQSVCVTYKSTIRGQFSALVGAIVGFADTDTYIDDCTASFVNISGIEQKYNNGNLIGVGCICGATQGNISNCVADECYIGLKQVYDAYTGIIAGFSTLKVSTCKVQSTEELFGILEVPNNLRVGGICGGSIGEIVGCAVSAGYLSGNIQTLTSECLGGIAGYVNGTVSQCSVTFNNGLSTNIINDDTYNSSIYCSPSEPTDSEGFYSAGGIVGYSTENTEIENCKYNGQSIVMSCLLEYNHASRRHSATGGIVGYGGRTTKCVSNVDGIIYSGASRTGIAGGIAGYGNGGSNLIAISDKIGTNITTLFGTITQYATSGDIYAVNNGSAYNNVYSNSSMGLFGYNAGNESYVQTNIIASKRPLTQIKRESFLKTVLGTPYQSLEYLEENPEAVWVIKDGEYPELYFTVLNDITVSDVEHGTISVDKTQAVDDEIVTVTAVPDDGYRLNKIYVNGEEITGTTFTVAGDSDVYATFAEIPAEYRVSVAANANASAGLVNVDTVSLQSVSLFANNQELSATDGEEIKVNTQAATDYTIDAIYVNGEELAGDSFIVTDDSVVTMDAVSISTDVKATTYNAKNIRANGATLSGKVDGDENSSKYIRYWRADTPNEIYTTEVETGSGEYSAEVTDLEPYVEYEYQMTEFGDVKSFTPEYVPIDDSGTELVEPTPAYDYPVFEIKNQQLGTGSISLDIQNNADDTAAGTLIIAAYDSSDNLITVKTKAVANIPLGTSKSFDVDVPDAAYYKLFIWKDIKSMLPMTDSVTIR